MNPSTHGTASRRQAWRLLATLILVLAMLLPASATLGATTAAQSGFAASAAPALQADAILKTPAAPSSAVPIVVAFNVTALGTFTIDTGQLDTATTVTSGAPNFVAAILKNNIGLAPMNPVTFSPQPMSFAVGSTYTQVVTSGARTFTINLTVTSSVVNSRYSRAVQGIGTISSSDPAFATTPVTYSAAYTENPGNGQINGSFNNESLPPAQCKLYTSDFVIPGRTNPGDDIEQWEPASGALLNRWKPETSPGNRLWGSVWDVDAYNDVLYFGHASAGSVTKFGLDGAFLGYFLNGNPAYAAGPGGAAGNLTSAPAFDRDASGRIYVVDNNNNTKASVIRFNADGTGGVHFIDVGSNLLGVMVEQSTGDVYVMYGQGTTGGVARYSSAGVLLDRNDLATPFNANNGGNPSWQMGGNNFGMAQKNGKLYLVQANFDWPYSESGVLELTYQKVGGGATATPTWGTQFKWFANNIWGDTGMTDPRDLDFSPDDGFLYVAQHAVGPSQVYRFRATGQYLGRFPDPAPTDMQFKGLAFACPAVDYGDAPTAAQSGFGASYPTTLANSGANHTIAPILRLGQYIDGEADGQPTVGADGDDTTGTPDDEDGMAVLVQPGPNRTGRLQIGVQSPTDSSARISIWIDFNQDGDFDDSGEQITNDGFVTSPSPGINTSYGVDVAVPAGAATGFTYARIRLCSAVGTCNTPRGSAPDGEVEDYRIEIVSTASLGDRVWRDIDGDGIQDAGEPGVEGVLVRLYRVSDNQLVNAALTDSSGNYLFQGLLPGAYYVEFVKPSGYTFTLQNQGGNPAADSDADPTTGRTANITLPAGADDRTWDAGLITIANTLTVCDALPWARTNFNHTFQLAKFDPALGQLTSVSVTSLLGTRQWFGMESRDNEAIEFEVTMSARGSLTLPNSPPPLQTNTSRTITAPLARFDGIIDYSGASGFADPDWVYTSNTASQNPYLPISDFIAGAPNETVSLPFSATGAFSLIGSGNVRHTVYTEATAGVCVNYTYQAHAGAIGNYVWVDENSDGYQDAGERGIPNVTVNLYNTAGAIIATTVTDSHGGYLFPNLAAGSYFVRVDATTLPAGMTQTTVYTNQGADFGNQDQSTGANDYGYPVTIGGTQPWENLTADFGYNYNPTTDVDTPPSGATAALGDRVWIDVDGDGAQDPDEVGVRGATVQLFTAGPDGIFGTGDDVAGATQVTDANGYYLFDGLAPGAYVVKVTNSATASHDVLGASYTQTGDPDHFGTTGTNNDNQTTTPVLLGPGDVFLNADFGYKPNQGVTLGTIGDTVWFDANASGTATMDAGEYGIPGVTVALIRDTNGNGVWDAGEPIIATDTTDASGQYLFTGLSLSDNGDGDPADADYIVWVNDTDAVLTGLTQTYDQDSPLDNRSATALTAGTPSDLAQDFSYTAAGHTPTTGLIGDTVWFDLNNSGGATQQAGEPGIEGVVMELLDSGGAVIATTTTDENGRYYFGGLPVSAGGIQYRVRVAASNFAAGGVLQGLAETYAAGGAVGGNQGNLVTLTTAAPINLAQDFSYTATQTPGRIGNLVWLDSNADGDFDGVNGPGSDPNAGTDDDEPAIGGVTVDLYRDLNCNGRVDAGDPRMSTQTTASAIDAGSYGADGVYIFNRLATVGGCAGNAAGYVVNVTDTAGVLYGYWHSLGTAGTNNHSQVDPYAAQISAAQADNLTADFGYYVEPACVGNFVWYDQDGDGIQDATEPGLNGVTLQTVIGWPAGGSATLRTVSGDNPNQSGTQVGWYSVCNLLLDEDYRIGSSTSTPAANQPAHVISVATAPVDYAPTSIGGADGNEGTLPLDDSNNHAGTVGVPVQGLTNTTQAAASSEQVIASYDFGYRAADWGDMPDGYNTLSTNNGARHFIDATNPTPRLGVCTDSEADGAPNAAAAGDDTANSPVDFGGACTDDEDGVTAVNNWGDGDGHVNVTVSGASACLNAWMDFANAGGTVQSGGNGSFDYLPGSGASEWIIQNQVMAAAANQLVTFPLPTPFPAGNYYLRFRLTPNLGNTATCTDDVNAYAGGSPTWSGAAKGGEVEDYRVDTTPLAALLAGFDATAQADQVLVTWETVSEASNSGFNLYRATSADGERTLLGFTPSAAPGSTQGASYSYADTDVTAGQTYWYWLEAIDLNGAATLFDPVSVVFQAPTAVTLSQMDATSGVGSSPWVAALAALVFLALGAAAALHRRVISRA